MTMTAAVGAGRRVVVTGLGAVTPLASSMVASWDRLLLKEHGCTTVEEALRRQNLPSDLLERELEAAAKLPCKVAAPVHLEDLKYDTRTSRFVQLALLAGKEAVEKAQLPEWWASSPDPSTNECRFERIGVSIGSGMSSAREVAEAARTMDKSGLRRLSPHFVPKILTNSAAGRLSVEYKLGGPNLAPSTACAAGAHAIGEAFRCIQYGSADVMLTGGTEATIDPLSIAGFCRLKALSTNPDPAEASRPFDAHRDGFVMGEGAAVLVLEELEHAQEREAPILAELIGYGLTGDGHHITSPDPEGRGAQRAMRMALENAHANARAVGHDHVVTSDIDYVNAHATSTPVGDEIEAHAISQVMGHDGLHVSSTKGATGHLLGAAGAIEAAFTVLALESGSIPPTRNLHLRDLTESEAPSHTFQHVTEAVADHSLSHAMSNSFGFGGTNACLIFRFAGLVL